MSAIEAYASRLYENKERHVFSNNSGDSVLEKLIVHIEFLCF